MRNPVWDAQNEYDASRRATQCLRNKIIAQEIDFENAAKIDDDATKKEITDLKKEKEARHCNDRNLVIAGLGDKGKRLIEAASEKGASSWLSALPLKRYGYVVNKVEFRDAVCLRYGWAIPNTPKHCGCGAENSIDHLLTCM